MEAAPYGVSVFPMRPGVVRTAIVQEARHKIPAIRLFSVDEDYAGVVARSAEVLKDELYLLRMRRA